MASSRLGASAIGAAALAWASASQCQTAACVSRPVASAECFAPSAGVQARCGRTPLRSAACFTVRARLAVANGAPSLRLWPVGGHRLLGAYGPDRDPASPALLPNDVAAIMRPPEPGALRTIVGDFTVCPLALARPGWMQPVCIARADHLVLAAQAPGS